MLALADDPFPRGTRKLSGYDDVFRVRVGRYRILYKRLQYRGDHRHTENRSPQGRLPVVFQVPGIQSKAIVAAPDFRGILYAKFGRNSATALAMPYELKNRRPGNRRVPLSRAAPRVRA